MRLTFFVYWMPEGRDEDDPTVFARDVERDFSRVPTIDEQVDLGEDWLLWPVSEVLWDVNAVSLGFEVREADGLDGAFGEELKQRGFYVAST